MAKLQVKYYLFFAFSLIFFCVLSLSLPFEYMLNFASDDSFFYLKISKNFSEGLGLTFDGLGKTSGFHPLYMFLLASLFSFAKMFTAMSPEALYRITCLLHIAIIHVTAFFAFSFFKKEENRQIKFTVFIHWCAAFVFIRDFGLESHITCLLLMLIVRNKSGEQEGKKQITYAALISLLFLSRIDYLWSLIPLLIFADFITGDAVKRKTSLAYNIVFVSVTASAYFIFNLVYTGNAFPVTMSVLSSFPSSVIAINIKELFSNPVFLLNQTPKLIILAAVLAAAGILIRKTEERISRFVFYASLGFVLNIIIHLLFNRYNIREWYLTPPLFFSALMFSGIYKFRNRITNYTPVFFLIFITAGLLYFTRFSEYKWQHTYDYGKKLETATGVNDLIYQFDYSGIVSFFSNRKIIDGDGFAGSCEYAVYLKDKKIPDYIREKKVKYISTIIRDTVRYDESGFFIFQNEPFLNPLKPGRERIRLVREFGLNSRAGRAKGYFVLINSEGL